MNDFRGYVMKMGKNYYVQTKDKKKVSVDRNTFPIFVAKLGQRQALLEIVYYISNDFFRTANLDEDCKNEILSTIGE